MFDPSHYNEVYHGLSVSQDHLWELGLRVILRGRGVSAELRDRPDIVVEVASLMVPITCKKVHSERGVEAQIRKGAEQIEAPGAGDLWS